MSSLNLNPDQKRKLDYLINEGIRVQEEIDLLRSGLNEAIKAQADEFGVKPKVLRKSISIAKKMNFGEYQEEYNMVEEILQEANRSV